MSLAICSIIFISDSYDDHSWFEYTIITSSAIAISLIMGKKNTHLIHLWFGSNLCRCSTASSSASKNLSGKNTKAKKAPSKSSAKKTANATTAQKSTVKSVAKPKKAKAATVKTKATTKKTKK